MSLPSLLLCVLSLASGCGDPAEEASDGSEDSDGSSGGTNDGEFACASSIPDPLPPPGPEVHGWEPTDVPTCGYPQVNTEPPPCIGTSCVEVVFCTDCSLDVSPIQSTTEEILLYAGGGTSFPYYRLTEGSLEYIKTSVEIVAYALDDGDLLGSLDVGEFPLKPLVAVRVNGNTGHATALVEFFHWQSNYYSSTRGRAMARNDPGNNNSWSLCSIPELPGVSEFLDYIPNPMDEVATTMPGRPIDYGSDILWRSRRYDRDAGTASQMWQEINGNGPGGWYVLSDDALFGELGWLRPQGGIEKHIYRYDLKTDEMSEIGVSTSVIRILGASGDTGQLVAEGVDDVNAPLKRQLYRVDPVSGEETLLLELADGDSFRNQTRTAVLGDYLYFVRSQAPGCLERIRISP